MYRYRLRNQRSLPATGIVLVFVYTHLESNKSLLFGERLLHDISKFTIFYEHDRYVVHLFIITQCYSFCYRYVKLADFALSDGLESLVRGSYLFFC